MNAKELQTFRETLLAQRDDLLLDRQRHRGITTAGIDTEDRDFSDQANAAAARDLNERIVTSEEHLLEKIDVALKRLDDGTFGVCSQCKDSIPLERLQAKPSASLCLSCQADKEKGA